VGVLYILDEPSIGLHQCENERLIATLERLRNLSSTVIVVEHDEGTMRAADHLVDLGPAVADWAHAAFEPGTSASSIRARRRRGRGATSRAGSRST
jgi:excinuclease ABC subunit A